jgi:ATP-binding cassette subfamily F protein 3
MSILRIEGLGKAFGIDELFNDVNFTVESGEKAGLVGENGAGKTTLMRCILGKEEYDSGAVKLSGESVGYVEQEADLAGGSLWEELAGAFSDVLAWQADMKRLTAAIEKEKDEAAIEELMKEYAAAHESFERAGGYQYESTVRKVAFGLGFGDADFARPVSAFSGGQKTRICLAKALIRQPDFLFLDEPTNHLDIEMVEWLEEFLQGYKGGVLIISHDRFFLDRVADKIIDLENKTVKVYAGNYTRFVKLKAEYRAALENAYEKQQAYILKTEEYIRKYKAGIKAKQARGREKKLGHLTRLVLPPESAGFNYFAFNPPTECAQRVAELEDVSAGYEDGEVLKKVSLLVRNGDGVALVGANGAGKTTLLKVLIGEIAAAKGRVKIGSRVKIGYYSQQHEGLNQNNSLMDELTGEYHLTEEQARRYLGAFLFRGDDVFKMIYDLSGGEKSRLAFLKLMLTGANFLILDEPTNHLDITAKEAVEEALMTFPGTFITVSHDRYFLDKVTNCTLELKDGVITEYLGNYSYYRQKKAELLKEAAENAAAEKKDAPPKKCEEKIAPKRQAKAKFLKHEERERLSRRYEGEIVMLEMELKGVEHQLNNPESHRDLQTSEQLAAEYERLARELEKKYELWEECMADE